MYMLGKFCQCRQQIYVYNYYATNYGMALHIVTFSDVRKAIRSEKEVVRFPNKTNQNRKVR